MKEYIIDRSKWVCGGKRFSEKLGAPELLNSKGRMCCLGQICKSEGVYKKDLLHINTPFTLWHIKNINPTKWMLEENAPGKFAFGKGHSKTTDKMIRVNDNPDLNQKERENKLKELALKVDIKLKFTGKLGVK